MNEPILIDAVLYGGPVDGVKIRIRENLGCVLAALRNEIHGYAWANRTEQGRWVYRHTRLLAKTGEGTRAAEVLRRNGQPVIELVPEQ